MPLLGVVAFASFLFFFAGVFVDCVEVDGGLLNFDFVHLTKMNSVLFLNHNLSSITQNVFFWNSGVTDRRQERKVCVSQLHQDGVQRQKQIVRRERLSATSFFPKKKKM